jgi:hypothetical protein
LISLPQHLMRSTLLLCHSSLRTFLNISFTYILSLRPSHFHRHPVLKHARTMFSPEAKGLSC